MGLWSRAPIYFPSMVVQMLPLRPQARAAIAQGRLPREVQFKVAPQHSKVGATPRAAAPRARRPRPPPPSSSRASLLRPAPPETLAAGRAVPHPHPFGGNGVAAGRSREAGAEAPGRGSAGRDQAVPRDCVRPEDQEREHGELRGEGEAQEVRDVQDEGLEEGLCKPRARALLTRRVTQEPPGARPGRRTVGSEGLGGWGAGGGGTNMIRMDI